MITDMIENDKVKKILYGGDYNPEQWPEETWEEDMRLLKLAHIDVVTLNVFSWASLQPEEDVYHFEKLDSIMDMRAVAIYGDIKKEERGAIVQQFQKNPATTVFIGQIDTAGTGITLTAADTCVYYSVNFNFATYSQSLSRIHRIGQKNRCTYIHLV